jgi:hypothetical protein
MLYAVTIEPLNTICFVSERPEENEWEVQEGVSLDAAPLYGPRTPDRAPLDEILCVSASDPKYFKVYRDPRDIDPAQFRPMGRRYGGIFSKPTWERFAKHITPTLAALDVSVDEPPGATEQAVAAIKQRG